MYYIKISLGIALNNISYIQLGVLPKHTYNLNKILD